MRNGLDISGHSEMAHEIAEKPIEAVTVFNTVARHAGPVTAAETRAARHGTQRMGRPFRLDFDNDLPRDRFAGLSTYEGAVAALGACVLVTHVVGYSVRGIAMTSMRVVATAAVEVGDDGRPLGGGLRDARYVIDTDCEAPPDTLREVTEFVTCFSPNHRAYVDEGSYDVRGGLVRAGGGTAEVVPAAAPEPTDGGGGRRLEVTAELEWQYGTEATVETALAPGGEARRQRPAFVVDQPKQMLGIDRGMNPQELLLAATSAELVRELAALSRERGLDLATLSVASSGKLDIRGMLNVESGVPPRFHDLRFAVRADSEAGEEAFGEILGAAAARNPMLATLRTPRAMAVELRSRGELLREFRSDPDQVAAAVAELARRQAEAMEAAPDGGPDEAATDGAEAGAVTTGGRAGRR